MKTQQAIQKEKADLSRMIAELESEMARRWAEIRDNSNASFEKVESYKKWKRAADLELKSYKTNLSKL